MLASLEGALSIVAALESGNRQIRNILLNRDKRFDRRLAHLQKLAREKSVPVSFVDADEIHARATGTTHGGVFAFAGERRYQTLSQLLPASGAPFVVMLDGIEDPYNFGFALRALYAAGVDGVALPHRNWTSASAIVGRASAGASERLKIALVDDAAAAADFFRDHDLRIATTGKSQRSLSLYDTDLTQPLFMLIGGEKRGVQRSFQNAADFIIEIPYGRPFDASLGTVSSASVIAFEVMRQRQ